MRIVEKQIIIYIISLAFSTAATASLIPDFWTFQSSIQYLDPSIPVTQVVEAIDLVQNPLIASHSAILGPSTATGAYNINITQTLAEYWMTISHSCVQVNNSRTRCIEFGRITLTPSVDTLLSADMTYAYFMPTDPMDVVSSVSVVLLNPGQALLGEGRHDYTDILGPHGGMQEIHTSVVLPAGRTARIQYFQEISYSSGSANGLTGTGDGTIHLTMTELPEPGSLALLSLAGLPLFRRRPCRSSWRHSTTGNFRASGSK